MASLSITRRQLGATLIGAATLAVTAGCTTTEPVPVHADRLLLTEAAVAEAELLAHIQAAVAALPAPAAKVATAAAASVQVHVARLADTLGGSTSASPTPSTDASATPAPSSARQLAELARRISGQHREALSDVDAPAAQLLASLAASDLVIAVALADAS